MKHTSYSRLRRALPVAAFVASGALIPATPSILMAQAHTPGAATHAQAPSQDQQLAKQVEELRAQVARLQAALDQQRQSPSQPSASAPAQQPPSGMRGGQMGQMPPGGMREMGRMSPGEMGMGRMSGGGMSMMDMHKGEMGMPPEGMDMPEGMMMNEMGRMGMPGGPGTADAAATSGSMPAGGGMKMGRAATASGTAARTAKPARSMSSLPGVPGASHLYHIGSTGFFLDQPQLTFTGEQQSALNKIKERALLERGNAERRIEQTEQELWALTGADQPDAPKVQAKVREIEQLRTNQRLAFIQAVGEATRLLTPEQRAQLLGTGQTPIK